jgi:hypothetical protein
MSDGATQSEEYRNHRLREQDRAIKAIRWACIRSGYACTVHGTRNRDLDLVAVPWTDDAETIGQLLRRIVAAGFVHSTPEKKPHGRLAYTVFRQGRADVGADYIDLSITPRQPRSKR